MLKKQLVMIVFTLAMLSSYAQVKISGSVYDEYLEPFYNAKISNGETFVVSDEEGNFSIVLPSNTLPQTITISAFGFNTEEVSIVSFEKKVNVVLKENLLLDQVVISASRTPEKIIESPVTIERLGLTDIKKSSSNSFYDALVNLKGVDAREVSYGYKSINTRGFADFNNSRFVQLVDGMDTAAPALNTSAGNLSGVSELDILSVEILPGASSALYGANAYNGIMIMDTKNPFNHTGISVLAKGGMTSQEAAGNSPFYDVSTRMAYKFSDAFAAKVNFSYFEAEEWHATDNRNKRIDTNEIINGSFDAPLSLDYDGINMYGDEDFADLASSTPVLVYLGYLDASSLDEDSTLNFPIGTHISRKGYSERELVKDYKSKNLKFSTSLHYRPFKDESLEIQLATRIAMGDNMFQGAASRFAQRNYYIGQSKLEIKGDNFFVRGYYTRNDAGDTYDLTRTAQRLNSLADAKIPVLSGTTYRPSWGDYYAIQYMDLVNNNSSLIGASGNPFNVSDVDSRVIAMSREFADQYRLNPGTAEFTNGFNSITSTLITEGGSKIYDKSAYAHVDANYNFRSLLNDWADVQVGGSYRNYNPESKGTIFNDANEEISIEEYGFYTQLQKKFLNDRLKFTGSIRYDKSENFSPNYSPRLALNYALGEEKLHIIRASYQTGFRNPTIQEQYMFLPSARKTTIGSTADNLRRIGIPTVSRYEDPTTGNTVTENSITTGDDIINNALLTRSVYDLDFINDKGQNIKSDYKEIQPEEVKTFELGYRSLLNINDTNLDIDFNAFYSIHNDFVFFQDVVVPNIGNVIATGQLDPLAAEAVRTGSVTEFNLITNAKSKINSYGVGIGLNTKLFRNFNIGANYNFTDFEMKEDLDFGSFEPNFNTPKHSVKIQFGNEKLFKNFGFNINARWRDKYRWVSTFVKGDVKARTVLDAQLNYRVPSLKSKFKIGGTNLFGEEYQHAPGLGNIGSLYYLSWIINN